MSLENASFINQLNALNPTTNDLIRQGDDQLRLIKKVLVQSLPGIGGPVNLTHTDLNNIPANLSAVIAEILEHLVPLGTVTIFDPVRPIPLGWTICDGHNEPGYGVVPNLVGFFIKGGTTGVGLAGTLGGSDTSTTASAGAHSHGDVTGGHGLTAEENGPHSHQIPDQARFVDTAGTNDGLSQGNQAGNRNDTDRDTKVSGSGLPHTHPITSDGAHTHTVPVNPRHYIALFIVKVTQYTAPVIPS